MIALSGALQSLFFFFFYLPVFFFFKAFLKLQDSIKDLYVANASFFFFFSTVFPFRDLHSIDFK